MSIIAKLVIESLRSLLTRSQTTTVAPASDRLYMGLTVAAAILIPLGCVIAEVIRRNKKR